MKQNFWKEYKALIKDVVLPYQYAVMEDEANIIIEKERDDETLPSDKSNAIENLRVAAGLVEGQHYGWWFQDTDVYKWLETVAYVLKENFDSKLKEQADKVIDLIASAQDSSGYLSTYYQIKEPELIYKELHHSHELYNCGHLLEAGIAYAKATQDEKLLKIGMKFVEDIEKNFGYEEGKIQGADGHQEIELALINLYEYTKKDKYLDLAYFFIDVRGKNPKFYDQQKEALGQEPRTNLEYLQAYDQPKNQKEAKGHAVRMLYMMRSMAELAYHKDDEDLLIAVNSLWEDVTKRKMYVTGGVGSTVYGEAFTSAYDLPNDTMYCETCAAIALMNVARSMFQLDRNVEYIEVMERSLYNSMLSGMSQDGKHFFYVNPLEVKPKQKNPGKGHVKNIRPSWLGCACCPPNLTRTIASIDQYFYSQTEEGIYIQLYGDENFVSETITIEQKSGFPKQYRSEFSILTKEEKTIYLRIPSWSTSFNLKVDGKTKYAKSQQGYISLSVEGASQVEINFEVEPFALSSNPILTNNANKVAFQYGPFVYTAEGIDNENNLDHYRVNDPYNIHVKWVEDKLAKRINLEVPAFVQKPSNHLYLPFDQVKGVQAPLVLIPYYLWANRGINQMTIWLPLESGFKNENISNRE